MYQAFYAGTIAVPLGKNGKTILTKATRNRFGRGRLKPKSEDQTAELNLEPTKHKYHQKNLPPAPSSHGSLQGHKFEDKFKEAEKSHLESHQEMESWIEISRTDSRIRNSQVLDCMWVYTYKFDEQGYLQKCKARLVVRGDQQQKATAEDIYAATLAGKSFRTLLATAARFDLEMLQFDAVNAFVNAKLPGNIFMRKPPGRRAHLREENILLLKKALYGLRIAPLLWQTELGNTLRELGFQPVPHELCCYSKNGILLFFYVDDIVIAFQKGNREAAEEVIKALRSKYKLTGGNDLQWFLGMEIIRDRTQKLLWVTQNMYLEKIYELRSADTPNASPMTRTELVANEETADKSTANCSEAETTSKYTVTPRSLITRSIGKAHKRPQAATISTRRSANHETEPENPETELVSRPKARIPTRGKSAIEAPTQNDLGASAPLLLLLQYLKSENELQNVETELELTLSSTPAGWRT
ncbi:hypothetical protein G7046_g5886 [Stylonectria norvegica]|nr:hypothetical protein G7046_g5886 [Stylonectria norvegica]